MKKTIHTFRGGTIVLLSCLLAFAGSCYRVRSSDGGGQIRKVEERVYRKEDVWVPPGYEVTLAASGFVYPSGGVTDDQGNLYVVEAGYAYGEVWDRPRLLKIEENNRKTVVASGGENGPWTGVAFHQGHFYIAEGGQLKGGCILRVSPGGRIDTLVKNLPGYGDHHTNGPVIHDGYIYFGQGTATNSGVVGSDNRGFGWLNRKPDFHDIPCEDIVLSGENFITKDNPGGEIRTGAFVPLGTGSYEGQQISGALPCSGAIMRVPVGGGSIELVAWGFRNPFGLTMTQDGELYVTDNAYDNRGSRPVWGAGDVLWKVERGRWYGWPDYAAGVPVFNNPDFSPFSRQTLKPLLKRHPGDIPDPVAVLGVHTSAAGLDVCPGGSFGFENDIFIAEFGDMAPIVGKVMGPVGFKVTRVDHRTGIMRDFAVNRGKKNGPASKLGHGGMERPIAVFFDRDGSSMYVVDFGVMRVHDKQPVPVRETGALWKITKKAE